MVKNQDVGRYNAVFVWLVLPTGLHGSPNNDLSSIRAQDDVSTQHDHFVQPS